jgi:acetyl-CoA carboxylase carboxyl transferase subunit alpha
MASEYELRLRERLARLRSVRLPGVGRLDGTVRTFEEQIERIKEEPTDDEIWHAVELARHQERPYALDYVERLLDDWFELHGDRIRADDAAVVAGLGRLGERTIAVVGQQKGRDL